MNEEDRDKMTDSGPKDIPTNAVRRYTRSTPLVSTVWMTGVLVWATVIGFLFHVPTWASIFLSSLTGLSFLLYMVSYIYLMATYLDACAGKDTFSRNCANENPRYTEMSERIERSFPGQKSLFLSL